MVQESPVARLGDGDDEAARRVRSPPKVPAGPGAGGRARGGFARPRRPDALRRSSPRDRPRRSGDDAFAPHHPARKPERARRPPLPDAGNDVPDRPEAGADDRARPRRSLAREPGMKPESIELLV